MRSSPRTNTLLTYPVLLFPFFLSSSVASVIPIPAAHVSRVLILHLETSLFLPHSASIACPSDFPPVFRFISRFRHFRRPACYLLTISKTGGRRTSYEFLYPVSTPVSTPYQRVGSPASFARSQNSIRYECVSSFIEQSFRFELSSLINVFFCNLILPRTPADLVTKSL